MDENKAVNESLYLPVSILLAAIIISASIMVATSNISNNLSGLSQSIQGAKIGGSLQQNSGNAGAVVAAPQPQATPPSPSKSLDVKGLLQGAAATEGKQNAPVVMIEYSDYQCPFCRSWFNGSKAQLDKEYIETGKVLFVYKDFPLSFHPMAPVYAEAARCAGDQKKYWEMHDKIFNEQEKKGQGTVFDYTKDDVKKWAQDLSLNASSFNSCLDTGKYASAVQANEAEGAGVGVGGTPSFVIGKADGTGKLIVGAQPYSVFKSAIDSILK